MHQNVVMHPITAKKSMLDGEKMSCLHLEEQHLPVHGRFKKNRVYSKSLPPIKKINAREEAKFQNEGN